MGGAYRPLRVPKYNLLLFSTFAAYQFLMIRLTVTFWRSLRTSGNVNDEPLAKIALWPVTLFYMYRGYYRNVLGQKFPHIFVDVWSLHKFCCADSFRPLGSITHASVGDVLGTTRYIRTVK